MSSRPRESVWLWEALSGLSEPLPLTSDPEPWVQQEQRVRFQPVLLAALKDSVRPLPDSLGIRLPGHPDLDVTIITRQRGARGGTIVQGRIDGAEQGDLLLSIVGDAVAGHLRVGTETWKIEPKARQHRLLKIDVDKLPPD